MRQPPQVSGLAAVGTKDARSKPKRGTSVGVELSLCANGQGGTCLSLSSVLSQALPLFIRLKSSELFSVNKEYSQAPKRVTLIANLTLEHFMAMPRIVTDPTRAICPSFEDPEWEFLRQSMVDAHQGEQPLTTVEAAQQMTDAWSCENGCKVAAWNIQQEQDQAAQAQLDRTAQEENEARCAQQEKEAEARRQEAELKKPKLNPFDPNRLVAKWIEPSPGVIDESQASHAPVRVGRLPQLNFKLRTSYVFHFLFLYLYK